MRMLRTQRGQSGMRQPGPTPAGLPAPHSLWGSLCPSSSLLAARLTEGQPLSLVLADPSGAPALCTGGHTHTEWGALSRGRTRPTGACMDCCLTEQCKDGAPEASLQEQAGEGTDWGASGMAGWPLAPSHIWAIWVYTPWLTGPYCRNPALPPQHDAGKLRLLARNRGTALLLLFSEEKKKKQQTALSRLSSLAKVLGAQDGGNPCLAPGLAGLAKGSWGGGAGVPWHPPASHSSHRLFLAVFS